MASIRREIPIAASPEAVWDAVRDVGAAHRRLVPGILRDVRLEPGSRVVTFADGTVVRELIVDVDDDARRFVYAARGGRTTHHNGSMQVFGDGEGGSVLLWITDMLPDEAAGASAALVDEGGRVMQRTLAGT